MSFIQANIDKYTVKQMCSALKFPRSTYYAALNHVPSKREQEYKEFSNEVLSVYNEFKKRYGAIKIHRELNDRNIPCSVKRVQRHMKKLVTDITYIHVVNEGWTYLASVMDLYDRKIIGWAYGKNITAELATQAVKNACLNIPDTTGIVLHSDLGSQYTSEEFEKYLQDQGMLHSFSRKGNPYDNACIESFHSVLKKEEVYTTTYYTFKEAKSALFEYIESFYNRKRPP